MRSWPGLVAVLLWGACATDSGVAKVQAPATAAPPPLPAVEAPLAAVSAPDDEQYSVAVESPQVVRVGVQSVAAVRLRPVAPWHLNLDFPIRLAVRAEPGTRVEKPEQRTADAVAFDDDQADFAVRFRSASAGPKAFTGKLDFAVCQADACLPRSADLSFVVTVAE